MQTVAFFLLTDHGKKVLTLPRGKGEFKIPGCVVEDGKSIEDTLRSEVQKQTGLIIHNPRAVFSDKSPDCVRITYCASDVFGDLNEQAIAWVLPQVIPSGDHSGYSRKLLEYTGLLGDDE